MENKSQFAERVIRLTEQKGMCHEYDTEEVQEVEKILSVSVENRTFKGEVRLWKADESEFIIESIDGNRFKISYTGEKEVDLWSVALMGSEASLKLGYQVSENLREIICVHGGAAIFNNSKSVILSCHKPPEEYQR